MTTEYEILVSRTGDRAEADTLTAALVAADTMCHDWADAQGIQGALASARESVTILRDGSYQGIATFLAREGRVEGLSADWGRSS